MKAPPAHPPRCASLVDGAGGGPGSAPGTNLQGAAGPFRKALPRAGRPGRFRGLRAAPSLPALRSQPAGGGSRALPLRSPVSHGGGCHPPPPPPCRSRDPQTGSPGCKTVGGVRPGSRGCSRGCCARTLLSWFPLRVDREGLSPAWVGGLAGVGLTCLHLGCTLLLTGATPARMWVLTPHPHPQGSGRGTPERGSQ